MERRSPPTFIHLLTLPLPGRRRHPRSRGDAGHLTPASFSDWVALIAPRPVARAWREIDTKPHPVGGRGEYWRKGDPVGGREWQGEINYDWWNWVLPAQIEVVAFCPPSCLGQGGGRLVWGEGEEGRGWGMVGLGVEGGSRKSGAREVGRVREEGRAGWLSDY